MVAFYGNLADNKPFNKKEREKKQILFTDFPFFSKTTVILIRTVSSIKCGYFLDIICSTGECCFDSVVLLSQDWCLKADLSCCCDFGV